MTFPLDRYALQARLAPALLVFLPVALSVTVWFPALQSWIGSAVTLAVALGGTVLVAQLARDIGKRKEPRLFESWGGKPTTALLRHADSIIDPITKARYHAILREDVPGLQLPSAEEERANPSAADTAYDSAVQWLLAQTRDREKHHLAHAENINYGFRRNLWALRPIGLAFSISVTLLNGVSVVYLYFLGRDVPLQALGTTALAFLLVILWICIVNSGWVQVAAVAYARALLHYCDNV